MEEIAEVTKLERRNIALGGFSQGGHIALQAVYGHVGFMKQSEWSCIRNITKQYFGNTTNLQGLKIGACFALSSFLCDTSSVFHNIANAGIGLFLSTGMALNDFELR